MATGKEVTEKKENPYAWRTLGKIVTKGLKIRLYFEPRNVFIGVFTDLLESGWNIWICLMPFFTIQIVLDLKIDLKCPGCGHVHNKTYLPKWCAEIITLKAQNKHLRDFVEKPLIRKIFIERAWREFDEKKKKQEVQR